MPTVEFLPSGLSVEVPPGTELLEAIRQAGIELDASCGGQGTCGACLVRVAAGRVDTSASPPAEDLDAGYAQACTTRVLDARVTVEVPEQASREDGHLVGEDAERLRLDDLLPGGWDLDPLAARRLIRVPPARLQDGLSDLDRVKRALSELSEEWGAQEVVHTLSAMRATAEALRASDGLATVTLIREPGRLQLIGIEAGSRTSSLHGIVVDLGTTTVAVQLVDLGTGGILATRTDYNAQIPCGLDVISRINYARRAGGLAELRRRAVDTINRLIHKLADGQEIRASEIVSAVVSGNTTMVHLLLGLEPEYIRLEPYSPTLLASPPLRAAEMDLDIDPYAGVFLSPCVGSYLGGDITAGLLCTDLATDTDRRQSLHRHRHQRRAGDGQCRVPGRLRLLGRARVRGRRNRLRHARGPRRDRTGGGRPGNRAGALFYHRRRRATRALRIRNHRPAGEPAAHGLDRSGREARPLAFQPLHRDRRQARALPAHAGGGEPDAQADRDQRGGDREHPPRQGGGLLGLLADAGAGRARLVGSRQDLHRRGLRPLPRPGEGHRHRPDPGSLAREVPLHRQRLADGLLPRCRLQRVPPAPARSRPPHHQHRAQRRSGLHGPLHRSALPSPHGSGKFPVGGRCGGQGASAEDRASG